VAAHRPDGYISQMVAGRVRPSGSQNKRKEVNYEVETPNRINNGDNNDNIKLCYAFLRLRQ
jgi:hypothetical protein